jgi:hypothetical protein
MLQVLVVQALAEALSLVRLTLEPMREIFF